MKFRHLFGFRVMVEPVEERSGLVLKPEKSRITYQLGRVVAVGDGVQPGVKGPPEDPLVSVGDLVWFQTNDQVLKTQSYLAEGDEAYLNLHQGDLLARFESPELFFGNMEALGRWVFIEPFAKNGEQLIVVPETVEEAFLYFRVTKLGSRVDLPLELGQEIMPNSGRVGVFRMRKGSLEDEFASYGYVDRDFVLATVEP